MVLATSCVLAGQFEIIPFASLAETLLNLLVVVHAVKDATVIKINAADKIFLMLFCLIV
jgi:hypothetical protein